MKQDRSTHWKNLKTTFPQAPPSRGALAALFAALALLAFAAAARADIDPSEEQGIKRIQILYPPDGAELDSGLITVGAGFSNLETPADPKSVRMYVDGVEVADRAEITSAYAIYTPPEPFGRGTHDVRVEALDVNKGVIEPRSWAFSVGGKGVPGAVVAAPPVKVRGQWTVGFDSGDVIYRGSQSVPDFLIAEKNGGKVNQGLSFSINSPDRSVVGSVTRETQLYTDLAIDKFRLTYTDDRQRVETGNFWQSFSDLSLQGAEVKGVLWERPIGSDTLYLWGGRTQDPSTSGTFKQTAWGARYEKEWNEKTFTALSALTAKDHDDPFVRSATKVPAKDEIFTGDIRFAPVKNEDKTVEYSIEGGVNRRTVSGAAKTENDRAGLARFAYEDPALKIGAALYDYGTNYFPVAEGSLKLLKNDREGHKGSIRSYHFPMISLSAEYEHYADNVDGTAAVTETADRNAYSWGTRFDADRFKYVPNVTWRHSRFVKRDKAGGSTRSFSEVRGWQVRYDIPAFNIFPKINIRGGHQKILFENFASAVRTLNETDSRNFSVDTGYKSALTAAYNWNLSRSVNRTANDRVNTRSTGIKTRWSVVPFKLFLSVKGESLTNFGPNADNRERALRNELTWRIDETYETKLGYDRVKYRDRLSPHYDYKEGIVRTELTYGF